MPASLVQTFRAFAYNNAWANGNSGIWCYLSAQHKWINFNGGDGLPGSDFEGIGIACQAEGFAWREV